MKKTDNQALVIFGASGDLTERKLIPSVFNLFCGGFLPENYAVVGVSRSVYTDEEYRQKVVFENEHLKNKKAATPEKLKAFAELVFYQSVNTKEISAYSALKERLDQLDKQKSCANNYIFYLATPPSLYQTIAKGLADSDLNNQENGWSRLIVKKPFGYDLDSAKKLNMISPTKSIKANSVFEPLPPPHLALKTSLNTNVNINNIKTGLINDHSKPNIEPRYRPIISRFTSVLIKLRLRQKSPTIFFGEGEKFCIRRIPQTMLVLSPDYLS